MFERDLRRSIEDAPAFKERFQRVLAPDFNKVVERLESVQFQGEHISTVLAPLFWDASRGQGPNVESFKTAIQIWDESHHTADTPDFTPWRSTNPSSSQLAEQFQTAATVPISQTRPPQLWNKAENQIGKRHQSEKVMESAAKPRDRYRQGRDIRQDKGVKGGGQMAGVDEEDGNVSCDEGTASEDDDPPPSSRNTSTKMQSTAGSFPGPESLRENTVPCHQCSYADEKCFAVKGRRTKHFKRACGRCSAKKIACSFSLHPDLQQRLKEDVNVPTTGYLTSKDTSTDLFHALDDLEKEMQDLKQGLDCIRLCQDQTVNVVRILRNFLSILTQPISYETWDSRSLQPPIHCTPSTVSNGHPQAGGIWPSRTNGCSHLERDDPQEFLSGATASETCIAEIAAAGVSASSQTRGLSLSGAKRQGDASKSPIFNTSQKRAVGRLYEDICRASHSPCPFVNDVQAEHVQIGVNETHLSSFVDLQRPPWLTSPAVTASVALGRNAPATDCPASKSRVASNVFGTEEVTILSSQDDLPRALVKDSCLRMPYVQEATSTEGTIIHSPHPSRPSSPLTLVSSTEESSAPRPCFMILGEVPRMEQPPAAKRKLCQANGSRVQCKKAKRN